MGGVTQGSIQGFSIGSSDGLRSCLPCDDPIIHGDPPNRQRMGCEVDLLGEEQTIHTLKVRCQPHGF